MTFTATLNANPADSLELTAASGSLEHVRAAVVEHVRSTDPLVQADTLELELDSELDGVRRYAIVDADLDTLGTVTVAGYDAESEELEDALADVEYGFTLTRNALAEARRVTTGRSQQQLEKATAATNRALDGWTRRAPTTNHDLASVCDRTALWLSDAIGAAENAASYLETLAWSDSDRELPAAEARNAHEALQGLVELLRTTRRAAIDRSRS